MAFNTSTQKKIRNTDIDIGLPEIYSGTTGNKQMIKNEPPQLALALSGCIRDLATQSDFAPLEMMTDWAKRSCFTHLVRPLWGYLCVFVRGEKGRRGPWASQPPRCQRA